MSGGRERVRESDFEYYEREYYKDLKSDYYKLKISKSSYKCPFCQDKREYSLNELLKHAVRFERDSRSMKTKDLAKHSALQLYIKKYLDENDRPGSVVHDKAGSVVLDRPGKVVHDRSGKVVIDGSGNVYNDRFGKVVNDRPGNVVIVNDRSEKVGKDQLFVWPWMGIVANIATEFKDGRRTGDSGSKLRDEFTLKGFHPLKVQPLWNRYGHSGFAIVEFSKDWEGFTNAMNFGRSFEAEHCGKRDYNKLRDRGDRLYGWVARDDDYHSKSIIGDQLRKTGDLQSVSGKQAEEKRKTSLLVLDLAKTLKVRNETLEQVCSKYDDISVSLNRVMDEKEAMIESYNNEIKKMHQTTQKYWEVFYRGREKARLELHAQRKELEGREKDLQRSQVKNENERRKLYLERKNNEMAIMEQNKADERVMHLAEEHKEEKEKMHKKILELQNELDAKQKLELGIQQLKGNLQVRKQIGEDDEEEKNKLDAIKTELEDKEEELEGLEALQQALVVKERKTNDELQDARKELIRWLGKTNSSRAFIGVKRMGELDGKPFLSAAKRKYSGDEVNLKAVELCSQYEAYLRDPNWFPFKVLIDREGKAKEVLDEEDEKLRTLKDEFGDDVFQAVVTALKELNEFNPSGRYPLRELWHSKEGRKASLKEGCSYIIKQWKTLKRKK
ncbi:hypothetical protein AAZX31_15G036800 [Glycine max]|uniref:Factor of DNA methylation 1-5/IDN2 domain-containing protein n=1 Tax=Glycine max TaxID=3847 RepID=I1MDE9_SOYBN|nr:factor of DNA methylation 4 [Glycine max]KAG4380911.1 hypothetical protein GLYMA_15G037800v4 [Glycine max]KAH1145421.1 hypothetical protein GYH30_041256 [Glycine max]KAH1145422.1 hypothetical protein GYH30_041256 [Glycine max]KRH10254.1 hypothetical protein GLYMA_15G037800v4 [Glycine max]|eukprot:XP_006597270.1 factor of DNA methylation 4 [Glycine max]